MQSTLVDDDSDVAKTVLGEDSNCSKDSVGEESQLRNVVLPISSQAQGSSEAVFADTLHRMQLFGHDSSNASAINVIQVQ